MASKKLGKSLIANVLIIVLVIGTFSSINLEERSTSSQLIEDNLDDQTKMFSQRNSNDWSSSASAANSAIAISVDTSPNDEIVVSGRISGDTTMLYWR